MKCRQCGNELPITFGKRRVFCSKECLEAYYGIKIKPKEKKKCEVCGKDVPEGRSKYCSKECSAAFFNRRGRKKTNCEICGVELTGRQRKYCSECGANKRVSVKYPHYKDQCRKPQAEPKKKGRPKKVISIAEICKRAKAEGLTYGQYVGKYGM